MHLKFTELAVQDIKKMKDRITQDKDSDVAERIVCELKEKLSLLCSFPGLGRERPDLTPERVEFFPFYSWLVVYEDGPKNLLVVRVVSAYRAPETHF